MLECNNYLDHATAMHNLATLKVGEVYELLDFCCNRAPVWYQAEMDRIIHQGRGNGFPAKFPKHADSLLPGLGDWELSEQEFLSTKHEAALASKTADNPSPDSPASALLTAQPTRVQPSRAAKRKAVELNEVKKVVTVKRRKLTAQKRLPIPQNDGLEADAGHFGDYHISKDEFSRAQGPMDEPSPMPTSSESMPLLSSLMSFRARLVAKLVTKTMEIHKKKQTKRRRSLLCALGSRTTARQWCLPSKRTVEAFEKPAGTGRLAAAVPDMLHSPSLGGWPLLPDAVKRYQEDPKDNIVEFAGLKFLVDMCGGPGKYRVLML